jgi:hypothetical protein
MAYTLTVQFRGLCVYVPGAETHQPQPWFGVFLVNADATTLGMLDNDPRLNRHFPRLCFNLQELKNPPAGLAGRGIVELEHQDVVIKPGYSPPGNQPLTISHKAEENFDLVPKLEDLLGNGNGAVLKDSLTVPPTTDSVVTRIHLTEGVVFTDAKSSFNGNPVTVRFIHQQQNPADRQIATGAALEMSGLQGDLEVRMRTFDGKSQKALVLADPGDNNKISLQILNLCGEELFGPPPRLPGVDPDFKLNYLVTEAGHDKLVKHIPGLPEPVAIQFDPGKDGGGEYARCTSPQAAPPTPGQVTTLKQLAADIGK